MQVALNERIAIVGIVVHEIESKVYEAKGSAETLFSFRLAKPVMSSNGYRVRGVLVRIHRDAILRNA